ncbi:SIR2 family protein [Burkholderia multivorans]|uniref:SIR2 family protein n=1 Tax=Burkholderia multivorans TaxID=87883 RepID=UPI00201997AF|nr:SIR2 family protein [Burkholderia multivorans]MCO1370613.1 SIR2 family protein [Burkholderia multivorans]MCO1458126.1 SIR2 family protein [Burkholderia multivorans]MCO1467122.1 SIR2 family protein [Burkholderia multivorans]UQO18227.1 SIR2 family protein [Burkholderia multivorans]UQO83957.1 SIR2 family protein [Burkholderia multivorans]
MLDSVSALAFEMQSGKGMFALLLGSGVSRSAKIPTGWDITLDLVRKVGALHGSDLGGDPEKWYQDTFGKAPDYSDLLDELATTPTLRQQVIRPYIEPDSDERARGEKLPTAAHRAIARLIQSGHVRIVLTTNFDRLLEQALSELGVSATVIASADQVAGAVPLVHADATIVKLHGDYLDTRIRNTVGELSSYEPAIDCLLDRVVDEFGLVVCGWSADWDVALKAAIDRAPSRRFPMYWATRAEPGEAAEGLIKRRGGRVIRIEGADGFFEALEQRVKAIEALNQPHPLSTDIAVAMLKEYLPDPLHRIRLHDFLVVEFNRAVDRLDRAGKDAPAYSQGAFAARVEQLRAAVEPILPIAYAAGMWSDEQQVPPWAQFVCELAKRRQNVSGDSVMVDLLALPATLVMYAFCHGAVVGNHPRIMGQLVSTRFDNGRSNDALGDVLNIGVVVGGDQRHFKMLPRYKDRKVAGSDMMADILQHLSKRELRTPDALDQAFARLEFALAFGFGERKRVVDNSHFWAPVGRLSIDVRTRQSLLQEWQNDFSTRAQQSELCLMAGLAEQPAFIEMQLLFRR